MPHTRRQTSILECGLASIGDVVKHQLDEIQHDTAAMRAYIGRAR
ncbi:MAG TPA: hypothetical protein VFS03_03295 [Microvirga sp.]|nr:hypothetical protein [Microvirga sp.]